jgi:hypothetical protein
MSFGGSVQAMIISIKNNARPKKNIFRSRNKDHVNQHSEESNLKYKTVSASKLNKIKDDIRKKAKQDRRRQSILALLIIIPIVVISSLTIRYKIQQYPAKKAKEDRKYELMILTEKRTMRVLKEGSILLSKGDYENAKKVYLLGCTINPEDYRINYANAKAYVLDCIENEIGCDTATRMVNGMKKKHGDKYEILHLELLLSQK